MNTIELSGDGLDGARVMAWMCFPDSPEMRQTLLAREILENLVADQSSNAAIVSAPVDLAGEWCADFDSEQAGPAVESDSTPAECTSAPAAQAALL